MLDQCAGADVEVRRRLLSMASRALPDPAVVTRWMDLALAESDTRLMEGMVSRLLGCSFRQIPDLPKWVQLLVRSLERDELRPAALHALGTLAPASTEATAALINAYKTQRTASARSAKFYLRDDALFDTARRDTLVEFLLSVMPSLRRRSQRRLLAPRLLRRNAGCRRTCSNAGWIRRSRCPCAGIRCATWRTGKFPRARRYARCWRMIRRSTRRLMAIEILGHKPLQTPSPTGE